jgi:hypothetical protein
MPPDVQYQPVTTGGAPAREVPIRGPRQNAYLDASYIHPLDAADRIEARSLAQADRESNMYDEHARVALDRQAAYERQAARRAHELERLQGDYLDTVGQLSRMKVDSNRLWNSQSTLDKIGATLLVMLGGVGAGAGGNVVLQSLMGQIEDDVEKQKMAYERGLDLAKGQQSAYGMAMQRFDSEDAAYRAALAAGQEAAAAKVAGMNAQWKGTDAANYADQIRGQLLMSAERTRAEGLRYLQPSAGSTKYKVWVRGQERPGLATEHDAQAVFDKYGTEPAQRVDEKLVEGGISATLQQQKLAAEAAKASKENTVVLSTGETVALPSKEDAKDMRALVDSTETTKRLVKEALEIRKEATTGVPLTPSARGRLKQIQADLLTDFGVQHKLGALSDADYKIAVDGTADLFEYGPGVNARLERLGEKARAQVSTRVKTYSGGVEQAPKAAGKMPSSFAAHGKK